MDKSSELAAWQLAMRYSYAMGNEHDRARSVTWIGEIVRSPPAKAGSAPIVVIHWFGWDRPDGGVVRVLHHDGQDLPHIEVMWARKLRKEIERGNYKKDWRHAVEDLLATPVTVTRRKSNANGKAKA